MARQEVIKVQCDRCKRIELQPPQPQKANPDFEVRLTDKKLVFGDICSKCHATLTNIVDHMEEWTRGLVDPYGPKVPGDRAAPLETAPDYSPPKPHSAAGAKRG